MADLKEMIEGFKKMPTASVSDAVDKVVGERGYMFHDMKPIFDCKFVGQAVTVKEVVSLKSEGPKHALECIEEAEEGSVLVISCEDGKEVAIFGGLMGTGCKVKNLAGAVLDGGCRDIAELKELNFPVCARAIVPSTTVGRRVTYDYNIPIDCAGVRVNPGDIIVADTDGVVVVPKDKVAEVYAKALEIEETEKAQTKDIWELKSVKKAVEKWARI
jgi:4-hydroxy-4-methyl-2-oxoglutarate aldolase